MVAFGSSVGVVAVLEVGVEEGEGDVVVSFGLASVCDPKVVVLVG